MDRRGVADRRFIHALEDSVKPQTQAVLTLLEQGGALTPYTALRFLGCFRLAARIHELRQMGYKIERGTQHSKSATYAKYWLVR